MLLADFVHAGADFDVCEVQSVDVCEARATLRGNLTISGKKYLVTVVQPYGGMAKIVACCGKTEEEAMAYRNELWALRSQAIREDWNGLKSIVVKRLINHILWYVAMGIIIFAILAILYVAFGLHHQMFAFFFYIPLLILIRYGFSKRAALTEPLYGTKAAEIWLDKETALTSFRGKES